MLRGSVCPVMPKSIKAWCAAFARVSSVRSGSYWAHRERLRRMVQLRLDRRVQGRIDPSDVIQEAFLDASRGLGEFAADPRMPPFVWLRLLTAQRLVTLHRVHLGVKGRDAARGFAP